MDREETIKAIAVMQAFVDGKVIECRNGDTGNWWCIKPDSDGWKMGWDFSVNAYRVKPEPRVIYVPETDRGHLLRIWDLESSDAERSSPNGKARKFIEVLD